MSAANPVSEELLDDWAERMVNLEPWSQQIAAGELAEVLPAPDAQLQFEVAIRAGERDPVILELFRRAGHLRIE